MNKPLWIETEEQRAMRAAFQRDYAMLEKIANAGTYLIPVCLIVIAAMFLIK